MKKFKKMMALVLATIMMFAMTITAMAASITIKSGADEDKTQSEATEYYYYKILEADISTTGEINPDTGTLSEEEEAGKVAYYVDTKDKADALQETGLFTVTKASDGTRWNVVLTSKDTDAETIASKLNDIKSTFDKGAAFTSNGNMATARDLQPGYYLITSSLGTKLAVQTLADVTINEKNTYPSNTKKEDKETASIGEDVEYTVEVSIPANVAEKDIKVVDTITKGLSMKPDITVTGSIDDSVTKLTFVEDINYTAIDGEKQYIATIPAVNVKTNAGQTLILTYKATVNNNAVINTAEKNAAHIEYDHYVSKDVEVEENTHGFTIRKIDGADVESDMTDKDKLELKALDGAEFSLWTEEVGGTQIYVWKNVAGIYRADMSQSVDADNVPDAIKAGEATIEGLASGTYYLQEDVAPTGYNKLESRRAITVNETTSVDGVDIAVENNSGTQLPSTGGIGTTIFYIIGAILVVGAGVLLVARRRMKAE